MMTQIKNISNLADLNLAKKLKGQKCSKCDQVFNDEELNDQNYTIWFAEDYQWENSTEQEKITLTIDWITHEKTSFYDCPDTELCADCGKRFRSKKMKIGLNQEKENYYCQPCFNEKYGDYLKARAENKQLTQEQKEIWQIFQKALNEHLNSEWHKTPGNGYYGNCQGSECEGYKLVLESYGYERE